MSAKDAEFHEVAIDCDGPTCEEFRAFIVWAETEEAAFAEAHRRTEELGWLRALVRFPGEDQPRPADLCPTCRTHVTKKEPAHA